MMCIHALKNNTLKLILTFLCILFSLPALPVPVTLDTSFDSDGLALTSPVPGIAGTANSVIRQSDGKLVVVGYSNNDFALARYNSDGSLDATFDSDGLVQTNISGTDAAYAVKEQADGKLVVSGITGSGLVLVRYNTNGSLDTDFGSGGVATIAGTLNCNQATSPSKTLIQQADNKWLVAAACTTGSVGRIIRLTDSGVLDATFSGGVVNSSTPINVIALQPDGKIVGGGCTLSLFCVDFKTVRYNSDGALDAAFGTNGVVVTDVSGVDNVHAVAIQVDAKIVVSGNASLSGAKTKLVRYNGDGSLDSGFGVSGIVQTDVGSGNEYVHGLNFQIDGKILVAGYASNGTNNDVMLLRYNADGNLDSTFDVDGMVMFDTGAVDIGNALLQQPDGNVVIAGSSNISSINQFLVMRFVVEVPPDADSDGVPDGSDNCANTANASQANNDSDDFGDACDADDDNDGLSDTQEATLGTNPLLADTDGDGVNDNVDKFPLDATETIDTDNDGIGNNADTDDDNDGVPDVSDPCPLTKLDCSFDGDGIALSSPAVDVANIAYSIVRQSDGKLVVVGTGGSDFTLARYNNDGSLDATFGGDGLVQTHIGATDRAYAIKQQADGKLVVGGATVGASSYGVLVRYNTDGSVDSSFGVSGVASVSNSNGVNMALAQQADGKWLAAWSAGVNLSILARFTQDGMLDSTFGNGGTRTASYGFDAVAIQQDGKIIVSGCVTSIICTQFHTSRYSSNGTLDATFGTNGVVNTDAGGSDNAYAVLIQPDQKIVLVGGNSVNTVLMRYNSNGSLDGSFGVSGIVQTNVYSGTDRGMGAVLQGDGKIVVAGYASNSTNNDVMLLRYNADGSLDSTFDGDGIVMIDVGAVDVGNALVQQPDGNVVVAGSSNISGVNQFLVMRFVVEVPPDADSDGDGVLDVNDAFPLDPTESVDTDNDGIGNNADWDDDGDNVPDTVDAAPLDGTDTTEIVLPLNGVYKGGILYQGGSKH